MFVTVDEHADRTTPTLLAAGWPGGGRCRPAIHVYFRSCFGGRFAGSRPSIVFSSPCEGGGRVGVVAAPLFTFISATVQPEELSRLAPTSFFSSPCQGGGWEGGFAALRFSFTSAAVQPTRLPGLAPAGEVLFLTQEKYPKEHCLYSSPTKR